ncbi:N-acetyltransferase family protein [Pseudooceanicola sp. C21-150M6]|uniref:GNAT family N-acetyltransferase n=1 Tax=Pseudooceanicola sp. C21-150M6 TaxID=3434355 RepID=UPI003D7F5A72
MSLVLRDAEVLDAGGLGAILDQSIRDHAWMPVLHSLAEDISFVGDMIEMGWVRVALAAGDGRTLRGFLAREGELVHALYVARGARGHGVGRQLMEDAMAACERLELWTFVANMGARRFYARLGFDEVEFGDGTTNDEGLPDVRLEWHREGHNG